MRRLLAGAGKPDVSGFHISRACAYFWASVPHLARDHKRVEELAAMHGELGRLGILIKLWLEDDFRTAAVDAPTLRAALEKIAHTQEEIHEIMRGGVLPVAASVRRKI